MSLFGKIEDLLNESDVEQKLIVPLIIGDSSRGFGYLNEDYQSKASILKLNIDKGSSKKLYRPDFIIFIKGTPVLVIEAKHPNEELNEGYREARLYANELNSKFETGINPCAKVIASNGKEIWYGNCDSASALGKINFNDLVMSNENFEKLLEFCSKEKILHESELIINKARGNKQYHKPIALLGGNAKRDEELGENLFGAAIIKEFQNIFNPESYEDRVEVVRNAYIPSIAIEKQTDPIRKVILSAIPPSIANSTKIKDTSKPRELINKLFGRSKLSNKLILLVGNVGSGKTTFIDYFREVALPAEIKEKTVWVYVNLNNTPVSKELIYAWLQSQIIDQLSQAHPEINLDSISELKKLYAKDIKAFEEGEGSLLLDDKIEYNKSLAYLIQNLKADKNKTTKAYTRYLCGERGKTFILVLDNCDKGTKEVQLLLFDVAKWAKEEYQALVFLPMRDITYDLNRTVPPLDTVINDMTFRIDPPRLCDVLYRRVAFALESSSSDITFTLRNDVRVSIPKEKQKKYFANMLESLYDSTPLAKKLIDGLSGRDIRRGIGIFISLCESGHISSGQIFKMHASEGRREVESHLIMKALLRGNKRFYSGSSSFIKNLFQSYPDEEKIPDPFVRIAILNWFEKKKGIRGPSAIKGFHRVSDLLKDLIYNGHSKERIVNEVVALLKERCLISEAQIEETLVDTEIQILKNDIDNNELIKIASAGIIHLELLSNITYLAACAEDVWFENQKIAQDIAERITGTKGVGHFSLHTTLSNSNDLISYLMQYHNKYFPDNKSFIDNYSTFLDLEMIKKIVDENIERFKKRSIDLQKRYPIGTNLQVKVDFYKEGTGIFVTFGNDVRGFIKENYAIRSNQQYQPGILINIEIIGFDDLRNDFILKLKN